MFLTWLDLLPQMQAFEHRFPRGREPPVHLRVTRNNFKNSFSCLLNIVTCDRGVGKRTPFIRKRDCDTTCHSPFLIELSHLFSNFFFIWENS